MERDEDGIYVVECPAFEGCYSQGATLDEALKNIHEAIELCLEDFCKNSSVMLISQLKNF